MKFALKDNHTIRFGSTLFQRHCLVGDSFAVPESIVPAVTSFHGGIELRGVHSFTGGGAPRFCMPAIYA